MAYQTLDTIREAIKTRLDTYYSAIASSTVHPQVYDALPATMAGPGIVVGLPAVRYYLTAGATGLMGEPGGGLMWPLLLFVPMTLADESQRWLARMADADGQWSVLEAIAGGPTLGGTVDDATAHTFQPTNLMEIAGVPGYAGELTLKILARRG